MERRMFRAEKNMYMLAGNGFHDAVSVAFAAFVLFAIILDEYRLTSSTASVWTCRGIITRKIPDLMKTTSLINANDNIIMKLHKQEDGPFK